MTYLDEAMKAAQKKITWVTDDEMRRVLIAAELSSLKAGLRREVERLRDFDSVVQPEHSETADRLEALTLTQQETNCETCGGSGRLTETRRAPVTEERFQADIGPCPDCTGKAPQELPSGSEEGKTE